MERLNEKVKVTQAIAPQSSGAATLTSSAIDTLGYGALLAILSIGAIGASGTVNAKIEESDTGSGSWSDVTGAAIVQLGDTDDNKAPTIDLITGGIKQTKRYARVSLTIAGATCLVECTVLQYHADKEPVVNSPVAVSL